MHADRCPTDDELAAFLEDPAGHAGRERVHAHIAECSRCAATMAALARAVESAGTLSGPAADPSARTLPAEDARVGRGTGGTRPGTRLAGHEPPRALGRFQIERTLGAGGMGVVYLARDPQLDRRVALKVLHPSRGGAEAQQRLLREAQAMARLQHPNVLAVYEAGILDDQVYLVMEYVEEGTLGEWSRRRPRAWTEILDMYIETGRGLAAAHAAGLVHRDFKPANVLIGGGRARISDFGLARSEQEAAGIEPGADATASDLLATPLTVTGAVLGTPAYMAPEQIRGAVATARSDQFAYCVALYEALHGHRPFPGGSLGELLLAIERGALVRPGRSGAPRRLHAAIARGLAGDPERRFPAMEALLAELQRCRAAPRTRRRVLALAGVALAIAGGFGVAELRRRERAAECHARGETIAAIWDDARATALRGALARVDSEYASEAAGRTIAAFDEFAARWRDARESSCLAANVAESRAPRLAARADECLVDAAVQLVEQVAAIETIAAPGQLYEAVRASKGLPDPRHCDDDARLESASDPGPAGALELRRLVARAEALDRVGRLDEAREVAERALAASELLAHPGWIARAAQRRAQTQSRSGRWSEAEATLLGAFERAMRAGDDRLAANVASDLVAAVDMGRRDYGEALVWARVGRSLLERARAGASVDGAQMDRQLGVMLVERGKLAEAEVALNRARARFEAALGNDHFEVATVLHDLGHLHSERGEWALAEARYRESLEIREQNFGPEHLWVADTLLAMGAAYEVQGLYDRAEAAYLRALPIYARSRDAWSVAAVNNNLGVIYKASGRLDEAERHYRVAVETWQRELGEDHPVLSHPYWGLSGVAVARGDAVGGREYAERCLRLNQAADASPGEVAEAEVALAMALWLDPGQRARALALARGGRSVFMAEGERRRKDLERLDAWFAAIGEPVVASSEVTTSGGARSTRR